jgi:hypothetical protein
LVQRRDNDAADRPSVHDKLTKNNATNVVLAGIHPVTQTSRSTLARPRGEGYSEPDRGGGLIRTSMLNRGLCLTLLFAAPAAGLAQPPAQDWDGIEALKPGASIRITLPKQKILCAFDSADDDGLVCHRRQAGVDRSISLPRSEIKLIRARNATGSVVAGTLIGVAVGAGIGAVVDSSIKNPNTTNNAKFTRGLSPIGGLLGALFGIATEFVPGRLLYKGEIQEP